MTGTFDWLTERIHDKKHFTARHLFHVSELSGFQPATISSFFGGLCFMILTFSDQAHLLANILLVGVPLLLIFVYPDEKPTDETFYFYFFVFAGITVFDRFLESIPCYYVLKVVGFLLFCLQPVVVNESLDSIRQKVSEVSRKSSIVTMKTSPKSSESSTRTAVSGTVSPRSMKSQKSIDRLICSTPPVPPLPKPSDVKVTIIEEYYREEELLSPNGTLIERIVSGPFRKESVRTESTRSDKAK